MPDKSTHNRKNGKRGRSNLLSSTGVIFAPAAKMRLLLSRKIFCNKIKTRSVRQLAEAAPAGSFCYNNRKQKAASRAHRRFRFAGAETADAFRNGFFICKKTKLFRLPKAALKQVAFSANHGYLMVESMVAIMIVTIGLLGIFALLSRSLSLNRVIADRLVAAYLAAEGIEIVKNMVDNNLIAGRPWNEGLADGDYEADYNDSSLQNNQDRFLRFDPNGGLYSYSGARPTNFQRTIQVTNSSGGEEITVNSKVQWLTRGGGRFLINLEDHFFNWR